MMTALVIDASLALKLVLPNDQQSDIKNWINAQQLQQTRFYAPTLWLYEITSAITKAIHFEIITSTEGELLLASLQQLNIELVIPNSALTKSAFEWTLRLKRATAYDSFYLALAQHLNAPLWTADKRLYNAVNQSWVCLIGK